MVRKKTTDPQTEFEKAMEMLGRGKHQPALRRLEKLLPLATKDPTLTEQIHLVMADIFLTLRRLPQAIHHAESVIKLNAENYQAYYLLGFSHSVNTDWDKSVSALRKALSLAPAEGAAECHRSLGWTLFNQNPDNPEGLEHLEKALQMAPTHIPILTDLAMVYAQQLDFDKGLTYAQRAAKLDPSDPQARELVDALTNFKGEHQQPSKKRRAKKQPAARPSTEAEWRELIAVTDDHIALMKLWLELHPVKDIDEANAGMQRFNELWNSTPRAELGGRSPNEMGSP